MVYGIIPFVGTVLLGISLINPFKTVEFEYKSRAGLYNSLTVLEQRLETSSHKNLQELAEYCRFFKKDIDSNNAKIKIFCDSYKGRNTGLFYPSSKSIYIKPDLSKAAFYTTIVHELTHYKQLKENAESLQYLSRHFMIKSNKGMQKEVLALEVEAHTNAAQYYQEFSDSTEIATKEVGWHKMIQKFSIAIKESKEEELLTSVYRF